MVWFKRFGWFLLGFVGILVALFLAGLLIAREHRFQQYIDLAYPPRQVWAQISNIAESPQWRTGLHSITPLPPRQGNPAYAAKGDFGALVYVVDLSGAPHRMINRVEESEDFSGQWTFLLSPHAGGTRLTILEEGEIYNPIFRAMLKLVYGYGSSVRLYMEDLERALATAPK